MIEEAVVALLNADATVSGLTAARIYPVVLPEDADPVDASVTFQRISDIPEYTLSDGVTSHTARIQITSWAQTAKAAAQLALAIRAVLEAASATTANIAIANAWVVAETMNFEPDMRFYRVQTDFKIIYAPTS